ncbi:MAG: hypothetical protein PHD40_09985 [Syntrophomonadaceae bacterium]|nr:hypothetical protein [Syntrophomonadaceae bacterium]
MIKGSDIVFDIIYAHPQTEEIFHSWDTEKSCILCEQLFEPLESVAEQIDMSVYEMLDIIMEKIKSTGYNADIKG